MTSTLQPSTVPPGRGPSPHRVPGTSCLATISLSLRDKSHSPIEAPHVRITGAKHVQSLKICQRCWLESRDRVDDLSRADNGTGVVREIDVERGMHLRIRVTRRRPDDIDDAAHRKREARLSAPRSGLATYSGHNDLLLPHPSGDPIICLPRK
jgi:hypothetical protein